MTDYIKRDAVIDYLDSNNMPWRDWVKDIPSADVITTDEVACILFKLFEDDCACNYNDNDEWLTAFCKYADTECPSPKEKHGCWKQFLAHRHERGQKHD